MQRVAGAASAIMVLVLSGFLSVPYLGIGLAMAQTTAYVSDQLEVTMRSGEGNQFRIVRMLQSGTEVEVLERSDGWTQVRAGGDTGWLLSRYLQPEPAARARLDEALDTAERLRTDNRQLSDQLDEAREALETLSARNDMLEEENLRMQQRLEEAGEGLQLADQNQDLLKQVVDLEREVQDLARENRRIGERDRQEWFLAGAGVIAMGMLIGILVTRIRWRRRDSWSNL